MSWFRWRTRRKPWGIPLLRLKFIYSWLEANFTYLLDDLDPPLESDVQGIYHVRQTQNIRLQRFTHIGNELDKQYILRSHHGLVCLWNDGRHPDSRFFNSEEVQQSVESAFPVKIKPSDNLGIGRDASVSESNAQWIFKHAYSMTY